MNPPQRMFGVDQKAVDRLHVRLYAIVPHGCTHPTTDLPTKTAWRLVPLLACARRELIGCAASVCRSIAVPQHGTGVPRVVHRNRSVDWPRLDAVGRSLPQAGYSSSWGTERVSFRVTGNRRMSCSGRSDPVPSDGVTPDWWPVLLVSTVRGGEGLRCCAARRSIRYN